MQTKPFLRYAVIFILISLLAYVSTDYIIDSDTPDSFKAVVDSLENNSLLKSKVGDYESFSYNDKDLPSESDNPAIVKIALNGSSGSLYLTCDVIKNDKDEWQMVNAVEDSLVLKK